MDTWDVGTSCNNGIYFFFSTNETTILYWKLSILSLYPNVENKVLKKNNARFVRPTNLDIISN